METPDGLDQNGGTPLSHGQRALWFLNRLNPTSPAYNLLFAVRLQRNVDLHILESALIALQVRHDALRSVFQERGEEVVCFPLSSTVFRPRMVDLQVDSWQEVQDWLQSQARVAFNLDSEPPFKPFLLKIHFSDRSLPSENVMGWVTHHICFDQRSHQILRAELCELYERATTRNSALLPPLTTNYAQFVKWEDDLTRSISGRRSLEFWKDALAGAPVNVAFPLTTSVGSRKDAAGRLPFMLLSEGTSTKVRSIAGRAGVTPFVVMLAAYKALLARLTGEKCVIVATPASLRSKKEFRRLIGYLVNTIVLRTELDFDATFASAIVRVNENVALAIEHQQVPFSLVVRETCQERDPRRSPFLQFAIVWDSTKAPRAIRGRDELIEEVLFAGQMSTAFELALIVGDTGDRFRLSFSYSTELFEEATVQRMLQHFQVLLESAASNPEQRISTLPLLSEAERHQILVSWNDTQADYPEDRCIHQLFADQAQRTPEATAAVFEEHSLSYRDLDDRSNQLAHYLRGLGVGPEVLVGICVERSLEMVIGLLGILKAGGAYVPLDPDYPKDRIGFMLDDTRVPVLLTLDRLLGRLPPANAQIVRLDLDWQLIAQQPATAPHNLATPQNLAYVIYTSGSTGTPKGVACLHRGISRVALGVTGLKVTAADKFLLHSSASTDCVTFEVWACILSGARLEIAQSNVGRIDLAAEIGRRRPSILWLMASTFQYLVEESLDCFQCVKHLLVGGERVSCLISAT